MSGDLQYSIQVGSKVQEGVYIKWISVLRLSDVTSGKTIDQHVDKDH